MVNIKQVAEHAGVSTATVYHVLNETRYVSSKTKEKVLLSIKSLGYEPSHVAKSLRTRSTKIVAFIVPNISDHLFGAIAFYIQESLSKEGYSIIVYNTVNDPDIERASLKKCQAQRVDAIVLAPVDDGNRCKTLLGKLDMPIVLIDRGKKLSFPFIGTKNYEGALLGLKHLKTLGYQKILTISPSIMSEAVTDRLLACREYGKVLSIKEFQRYLTDRKLYSTALFTTNYQSTFDVLQILKDMQILFPEDIGLLVYDDATWLKLFNPAITAIRQQVFNISACISSTVLELINGIPVPQIQEFHAVLRCRKSTRLVEG